MTNLNETLDHIGNVTVDLALQGAVPSSIAAMEQLPQAGRRLVHLHISDRGMRGCVLTNGQQVIHAELRSAEVQIAAGTPGRVVWSGEAALRALAILCNRPVEVQIVATAEPVAGHAANIDWPLSRALLEMVLTIDKGMAISALPCALEA